MRLRFPVGLLGYYLLEDRWLRQYVDVATSKGLLSLASTPQHAETNPQKAFSNKSEKTSEPEQNTNTTLTQLPPTPLRNMIDIDTARQRTKCT